MNSIPWLPDEKCVGESYVRMRIADIVNGLAQEINALEHFFSPECSFVSGQIGNPHLINTRIKKKIMKALSNIEVNEFLSSHLKNWSFEGNSLKREFKFKTFVDAFSFMTAIAIEAEKMDHHPDWSNVYNSVKINLNTHDAHGITKLDFDLANKIEKHYENYTK